MTYAAVDIHPSYERVLITGLTFAEVLTYEAPADVWALAFRQES